MTSLKDLVLAHASGRITITDTIEAVYDRIAAVGDDPIFIALKDRERALSQASALTAEGAKGRPLYGVPVVVKDNIDDADFITTAACPAFAYRPQKDATAVARLKAAGAIIIGKTNLDQFATGLVGVRSPYGVPKNALKADLVPGGSSSGSASAVAQGIVPVALGTDTAGSGRVPAGLQNIVGLKPSPGLVPTTGVVPACRSLDCVSVFALTVEDAWMVLAVMAGTDEADIYSKPVPLGLPGGAPPRWRLGVPLAGQRNFGGSTAAEQAFGQALVRAEALGAELVSIDLAPCLEAALLLYNGPWVAERYLAIETLLKKDLDAILPVTREIIAGRPLPDAADTFRAFYRLAELRRAAEKEFNQIDMLMVPTAPRPVSLAEIAAEPIAANSLLGRYTNFVNLFDLCALAMPNALDGDNTAHGVTLIAPSGRDAALASVGAAFHAAANLPLGATGKRLPPLAAASVRPIDGHIELVVVGAHLSGMALNHELTSRGGTFLRATTTTPDYRFYALAGGPPKRPGLIRVADGEGAQIAVEVWALPPAGFASFVASIPAPLGIGTLRLADGSTCKGFLAEAEAVKDAADITAYGGWRAYMKALAG